MRGLKPIELANKAGLDKSLISCYLSGKYKAGEEKLSLLSKILDVNEMWLAGYDVDLNGNSSSNEVFFDEVELLFAKHKDILTESDKNIIKTIIEERTKKIDKELGEE